MAFEHTGFDPDGANFMAEPTEGADYVHRPTGVYFATVGRNFTMYVDGQRVEPVVQAGEPIQTEVQPLEVPLTDDTAPLEPA